MKQPENEIPEIGSPEWMKEAQAEAASMCEAMDAAAVLDAEDAVKEDL